MKTFVKYVLLFICFGIGVTAATAGPHDKSAEQIVGELLAAVPINTMAEPSDSGADWVDHAAKEISKAEEAARVNPAKCPRWTDRVIALAPLNFFVVDRPAEPLKCRNRVVLIAPSWLKIHG